MMEKRVSILLVDDDEGMLKTLNYILLDKGYEVITSNNGHKAIHLIKERFFDIALIDIRMPEMDILARTIDAEFCSLFWMKYLYAYIEHTAETSRLSPVQIMELSDHGAAESILKANLSPTGERLRGLIKK